MKNTALKKMQLKIHDTFNTELPSDKNLNNSRRQVHEACFSFVTPRKPGNPSVIHTSDLMAEELGVTRADLESKEFLEVFTGNSVYPDTHPYAMCYGGHQFGHWAGQLGDGRAINLMEVTGKNQRWALQLKGAGETPYSRSADGLAVLRSSIREHLCSEAMFHLGVPTTRSLSLSLSGDEVLRDMMYDGNSAYEKGAIVCRVAESFIRFGSFEIFASRKDKTTLKKLADYTICHFYPEVKLDKKDTYIQFFNRVLDRTLKMIIEWQRVGFVHGVMNTDNLSILGLTIDYGPYGWLEGYDHNWTPNTTDRQNKRYRYGNQPMIGLWNLFQLANTLFVLSEDDDPKPFEEALERYKQEFVLQKERMMTSKLGFEKINQDVKPIIDSLEKTLQLVETDMTIFFRLLSNVSVSDQPEMAFDKIQDAFYTPDEINEDIKNEWLSWFKTYLEKLSSNQIEDIPRKRKMNLVNPKYVLRNYMAQLAIDDANKGDYALIDELYIMLKRPYEEQAEYQKWFAKRPDWARHKVGCSMLSCSS